ncbi:hypothetical protein NL108_015836 [Boleophthalmus pectinirostris]|uniref:uncharacterized protein LOC110168070 n=1 Tax=Boleophthalmus pectinirostris TaxID=150288 RepID=UPI00242C98DF|nr:uncharacterized protein LOC110168070 [Boleophthalmus pectinirostris]KAJ0066628.1 hypothetical protein NL108_015836 [Boleophthalmus pectinirostris]
MASTPSASALSAVLRCQRNIWPAPSARLTGSTARELPVETASLWNAFTHGERIVLGRLALSCNGPWKKKHSHKVCQRLSQPAHAHTDGHAPKKTGVSTRISLRAHRAKVAFVCESGGERTRSVCPRGLDTDQESAWLWARGACVSMTSLLSHFVMVRLRVLFCTRTGHEVEGTSQREEPQTSGAATDSRPAEGAVRGARIKEDRPD